MPGHCDADERIATSARLAIQAVTIWIDVPASGTKTQLVRKRFSKIIHTFFKIFYQGVLNKYF